MIRTFYVTNLCAALYDNGKMIAVFAQEGIPRRLGKIFTLSTGVGIHNPAALAVLLNLDAIKKIVAFGPGGLNEGLLYSSVFRITLQHNSTITNLQPIPYHEYFKVEREILDGKDNG